MKIFTLTKSSILTLFSCILIGALMLTITTGTAVNMVATAAEPRDIPIYCVDRSDNKVAISFDAAWGNEQTETLLQILKDKNVTATFFLVGDWVEKFPDSVKSIAKHGHDVENHSDTHPYMTQLSAEEKTSQLINCNDKIKKLTGKSPTLFRPPYGDYDNSVVKAAKDAGMYCVQWDIDSLDWKDPSPSEMVQRITSKLTSGSIILMHNGAKNTPEALPLIIDAVRAAGYEFVPISEILLEGEYTTDHEGRMCTSSAEGA